MIMTAFSEFGIRSLAGLVLVVHASGSVSLLHCFNTGTNRDSWDSQNLQRSHLQRNLFASI